MSAIREQEAYPLARYPISLDSAAAAVWGHGGLTLSARSARCLVDAMDRQAAARLRGRT
jgi:hypothetical protein